MATLLARLTATGFRHLSREQRQQLGEIVKKQFFQTPLKKRYYKKVEQTEKGETFQVLYYDPRFSHRIDDLIKFYCEYHRIQPKPVAPYPPKKITEKPQSPSQSASRSVPKRERKRIPVASTPKTAEKVFSVKRKNDQ